MTDGPPFVSAESLFSFVDTDVLIEVERGDPATVAWLQMSLTLLAITGANVMEFIQGSRDKPELLRRLKFVRSFVIVWTTAEEMKAANDLLVAHCLSSSLQRGDALIAATVRACHAPLYTRNKKHFKPLQIRLPSF